MMKTNKEMPELYVKEKNKRGYWDVLIYSPTSTEYKFVISREKNLLFINSLNQAPKFFLEPGLKFHDLFVLIEVIDYYEFQKKIGGLNRFFKYIREKYKKSNEHRLNKHNARLIETIQKLIKNKYLERNNRAYKLSDFFLTLSYEPKCFLKSEEGNFKPLFEPGKTRELFLDAWYLSLRFWTSQITRQKWEKEVLKKTGGLETFSVWDATWKMSPLINFDTKKKYHNTFSVDKTGSNKSEDKMPLKEK